MIPKRKIKKSGYCYHCAAAFYGSSLLLLVGRILFIMVTAAIKCYVLFFSKPFFLLFLWLPIHSVLLSNFIYVCDIKCITQVGYVATSIFRSISKVYSLSNSKSNWHYWNPFHWKIQKDTFCKEMSECNWITAFCSITLQKMYIHALTKVHCRIAWNILKTEKKFLAILFWICFSLSTTTKYNWEEWV